MKLKCLLALGRLGDILNILPLAEKLAKESDTGKIKFAVAEDYAEILESVSYVDPVIWPGRFEDLLLAKQALSHKYDLVHAQVYGVNYALPKDLRVVL